MTQTFYSRIDLWFWLVPLVVLYPICLAVHSGDMPAIVVSVLLFLLTISMMYCVYCVDGEALRVQCGPFPYPKMRIADIVSIRKTSTLLSSPALSLDRIMVTSVKGRRLCISPKDRIGFIQTLTAINPNIKVDDDCLLDY